MQAGTVSISSTTPGSAQELYSRDNGDGVCHALTVANQGPGTLYVSCDPLHGGQFLSLLPGEGIQFKCEPLGGLSRLTAYADLAGTVARFAKTQILAVVGPPRR